VFRKIALAVSALAVTAALATPFSVGAKWAGKSDSVTLAGKRSSWG